MNDFIQLKIVIRIGDYLIYPAAIITFGSILILLLIIIIALLIKKGSGSKSGLGRISDWQKQALIFIIDCSLEKEDYAEYKEDLLTAKKNLENCNSWTNSRLIQNKKAFYCLNEAIFDQAIEMHKEKNNDTFLLLLTTLDIINSDEMPGQKWMIDEIKDFIEPASPDNIKKMKSLWESATVDFFGLFEENKNYIDVKQYPMYSFAFLTSKDMVENAYNDIHSSIGLNIKKESSEAIVNAILQVLYCRIEKKRISAFDICYIRALLCALEKADYLTILGSL